MVAPDIMHPLGEVELAARLHTEERPAHVNHLPSEEESEPGQAGKGSGSGAEDSVTSLAVSFIAALAKLAFSEAIHHKREGGKTKGSNPEAIDNHVDEKFHCEDTCLQ